MLQIWKRNSDSKQEREKVLGLLPSCIYQKIKSKIEQNSLEGNLGNNYSNDILVSSAGQAKIATLDSCLKLVSSDFIVF